MKVRIMEIRNTDRPACWDVAQFSPDAEINVARHLPVLRRYSEFMLKRFEHMSIELVVDTEDEDIYWAISGPQLPDGLRLAVGQYPPLGTYGARFDLWDEAFEPSFHVPHLNDAALVIQALHDGLSTKTLEEEFSNGPD